MIGDRGSDFGAVLESCGAQITRMSFAEALGADLSRFDAFCVFFGGGTADPRLRVRLEEQYETAGKRVFAEAAESFGPVYCAGPADTTTRRLVNLYSEEEGGVPGLVPGELLDDCANRMLRPWQSVPGMRPLLMYGDHIVAHRVWNADRETMMKSGEPGLWTIGENLMMSSFELHDFARARFAPTAAWRRLIAFIAEWLTGIRPSVFPAPPVRFGTGAELSDDAVFERCGREGIDRGVKWLRQYLVDGGRGGIREGLRHNISPDGEQLPANAIRTDCTGETAGAFRFYAELNRSQEDARTADDLRSMVFGPMMIKGGLFDGMLRWTDSGWGVCYQDDAARAVLPALYECLYLNRRDRFPDVCRALDFLVKTTAADGCRNPRTDAPFLDEEKIRELAAAEHGCPSAHYNAYYHAALLAAYLCGGKEIYLDVGRRGLETIMALYPETRREQSETEEMCRLILPLALLYRATGEERHREMLYRVADDLTRRRHPSGAILEWDTGYKASCARTASGECSVLTENGDPVADLLYSVNWLPLGFATAYHVTGDRRFYGLWREVCSFCLNAQARSEDPKTDGCWFRAFDPEMNEPYGCPHDAGWGPLSSESGWTNAEILMGLMLPDILNTNASDQMNNAKNGGADDSLYDKKDGEN